MKTLIYCKQISQSTVYSLFIVTEFLFSANSHLLHMIEYVHPHMMIINVNCLLMNMLYGK